jgi:hypothetical protein
MLTCRPSDNNDVKNAAFRELTDHEYRYYQHIYTDGSKMDGKTGYALLNYKPFLRSFRLLKREIEVTWAIFSDSLSSLQAIESMYPKSNPILTEIQEELAQIGEMKTVKFVWTPSHAGISGNEKADEEAKEALRQCLPPQSTVMATGMINRAKFNAKKNYRTNLATIQEPHDSNSL